MKGQTRALLFLSTMILSSVIIYFNPPGNSRYYPKCIFKSLTTLECPGCGSARSIYSLLHGDILEAADFNLLLLILLPVLMIGIFTSLTGHCQKLWDIFNKPRIYLILISLFWIARNIPFFPFTVLHSDK